MHAGREPCAAHERRGGQRRARHDVGVAHRALEVAHRASPRMPSRVISRAAASACAGVRLHTLTRSIGRTWRCASTSPRAMPARRRPSRDAARRARASRSRGVRRRAGRAARRDLLAVEQRERPRRCARRTARTRRRPRARRARDCPGNTVTSLTPMRRPVRQAGISSSDAAGSPGTSIAMVRAQRRRDVVAAASRRAPRASAARAGASRIVGGVEVAHRASARGAAARRYAASSESDSSAALPPAAAVLTVTVRSTTRRAQS